MLVDLISSSSALMIKASMLDFARTGFLGPIRCGLPREDLRSLLGDPPKWGLGISWTLANIWRYGDVEFHFHDTQNIRVIFSDHDHLAHGGETLVLDPWVVQKGLPRTEFEIELAQIGIDFSVKRPSYDPSQRIIVTTAQVNFIFIEEDESGGTARGLAAWSITESPGL